MSKLRIKWLAGVAAVAALVTLASAVNAQTIGADLVISQTGPAAPSQGGTAAVRITVTNSGDADASSFLVIGGVSGATLNSISGAGAACAKGRNSVYTCSLPGLSAGQSADLFLSAGIDKNATVFTITATLNGGGDVDLTNNRSVFSAVVVAPPPDVQMSGSASTRSPNAGAFFDYIYQIKVGGNTPASGVVFTDVLPLSVSLEGGGVGTSTGLQTCDVGVVVTCMSSLCTASPISGSVESAVVRCTLGDMPVGSQIQVAITGTAPSTVGATFSNTAVAFAADARDIQPGNNSVTMSVTTR